MAKQQKSAYEKILKTFHDLKKKHPSFRMGQHFSTALAEYGEVWGMTDKEFLFALEKYQMELEYDIAPDKDLDTIIEEGKNLDTLFNKEEEEEEDYE